MGKSFANRLKLCPIITRLNLVELINGQICLCSDILSYTGHKGSNTKLKLPKGSFDIIYPYNKISRSCSKRSPTPYFRPATGGLGPVTHTMSDGAWCSEGVGKEKLYKVQAFRRSSLPLHTKHKTTKEPAVVRTSGANRWNWRNGLK